MPFFRTKEQKEMIQELESVIRNFSGRAQELDETGAFPFKNIEELKKSGYTKLTLPKQYGGQGGSLYDYLLAQERIARECGPTALSIGWHVGIVLNLTEKKTWKPEALRELFQEVSKGALLNSAASEPQTGSPTRGGRPATTAVKQGKSWIINGRKNYTSMAPVLDYFLVSAWVPEEETIGWFLIHREVPGVSIDDTWDMISMQGTGSHDLVLENVAVEDKYFVERQSGIKKGEGWLLHIPACYIGIAAAARDYAIEFAKTHSPNSLPGPIRDLPNVQRTIGEIEIQLKQARHFLYSVAEKWENTENRELLTTDLAAVKFSVTNSAISIVDKAMRVVGAKSLQRNNPLQRYYRDVRAGLHNPPMDDAVITMAAKSVLFD
ncbi:acyl-CoA dehydrogenase [Bacillus sp. M6-12]|uniref:acyl-CoA dehydrogenase family protein n=1 Tax=Bacillus sp. M6-12 TaxID=2054166 RepID=UPI000C77D9DC|nr:acyl-CoA dehydrogenase family protein [Bacillus sp. M6-12]PLS18162.1 acyl-CoA dehydrogenase [Bacillus sp. M6-12]